MLFAALDPGQCRGELARRDIRGRVPPLGKRQTDDCSGADDGADEPVLMFSEHIELSAESQVNCHSSIRPGR